MTTIESINDSSLHIEVMNLQEKLNNIIPPEAIVADLKARRKLTATQIQLYKVNEEKSSLQLENAKLRNRCQFLESSVSGVQSQTKFFRDDCKGKVLKSFEDFHETRETDSILEDELLKLEQVLIQKELDIEEFQKKSHEIQKDMRELSITFSENYEIRNIIKESIHGIKRILKSFPEKSDKFSTKAEKDSMSVLNSKERELKLLRNEVKLNTREQENRVFKKKEVKKSTIPRSVLRERTNIYRTSMNTSLMRAKKELKKKGKDVQNTNTGCRKVTSSVVHENFGKNQSQDFIDNANNRTQFRKSPSFSIISNWKERSSSRDIHQYLHESERSPLLRQDENIDEEWRNSLSEKEYHECIIENEEYGLSKSSEKKAMPRKESSIDNESHKCMIEDKKNHLLSSSTNEEKSWKEPSREDESHQCMIENEKSPLLSTSCNDKDSYLNTDSSDKESNQCMTENESTNDEEKQWIEPSKEHQWINEEDNFFVLNSSDHEEERRKEPLSTKKCYQPLTENEKFRFQSSIEHEERPLKKTSSINENYQCIDEIDEYHLFCSSVNEENSCKERSSEEGSLQSRNENKEIPFVELIEHEVQPWKEPLGKEAKSPNTNENEKTSMLSSSGNQEKSENEKTEEFNFHDVMAMWRNRRRKEE